MELNEIHTEHEHATTSLKVVLLVFAIVLIGALSYLVWAQNTASDATDYSAAMTKKTTTSTPSTSSTTPSTTKTDDTDSWKTYADSDYGFTLTFGDLWKGYKVKKFNGVTGALMTYSFTTPFSGIEASDINDAGYYALFTVTVRTKDQYNALENKGVLLGTSSSYVFTYAVSQESVETLKALQADVTNVASTFKLSN
jgi:hypothetical protein